MTTRQLRAAAFGLLLIALASPAFARAQYPQSSPQPIPQTLPQAQPAQPVGQPGVSGGAAACADNMPVGVYTGAPLYGAGHFHYSGYPWGPRIAPPWNYYGLPGGPFVGYPWGAPGYQAKPGLVRSNGLLLYGPPVPVYGPLPEVCGNLDPIRQGRHVPSPGVPFGWVGRYGILGIYSASPRPRPLTVSVWPQSGSVVAAPATPAATAGGCMTLAVKVPQPAAEVFVDGVKTAQTGTDRVFESPPLEAGKAFRYEVTVRWTERGAVREQKREVTGTPGEVVRLDFTNPGVVTVGK